MSNLQKPNCVFLSIHKLASLRQSLEGYQIIIGLDPQRDQNTILYLNNQELLFTAMNSSVISVAFVAP